MTTLQYEDSGCRKKQIEEERDEFAIGFAKYVLINNGKYKYVDLEKMLKLFKKENGL